MSDEHCELPAVRRVPGAGLTLAYREWCASAAGDPIVLLHGITASSASWRHVAASLPGRRLVAFDARGHGESDWDPGEAYTVDMHFADIATALDALEIARCVLAGFSMGGGVAILAAAAMPERVSSLAVIDTYPYPEQSPGSARIARWVSAAGDGAHNFDPAISRRFRELLDAGVATRADLGPMWRVVTCPTVIVRGAESHVLPAHTAANMVADLPHARLETIEGVGHGIPYTRPGELAAALAALADATPTE